MTADDLREALEAAIREAVGPMTASKSWRDGVAKVATDAALHILDARPTPSEPEATVVEEWGVLWADGDLEVCPNRDWAEDRITADPRRTLVRRTRTTYADRVTEWTEADR